MIEKVTRFLREVRTEMKSVTWPSKADIKEGTIVVVVMSAMVAVFLSLVDYGFHNLIERLF